jgi:hypothetical protein
MANTSTGATLYGGSRDGRGKTEEDLLDDAVADSFPASDPVSLAMPHKRNPQSSSSAPDIGTMLLIAGGILGVIALLALRR